MVSEVFGRKLPDPDFRGELIGKRHLVTVSVLYYLPDHPSLINEFLWQTMDLGPKYPRIGQFLDFWRREIDATIKEVMISGSRSLAPRMVLKIDEMLVLH
jgi:uncharacterized protein Usg